MESFFGVHHLFFCYFLKTAFLKNEQTDDITWRVMIERERGMDLVKAGLECRGTILNLKFLEIFHQSGNLALN